MGDAPERPRLSPSATISSARLSHCSSCISWRGGGWASDHRYRAARQPVIRSVSPSHSHTTYDFRLFPATPSARALLPAQPLPHEFHSMIRVRAQPRSLRGKLREVAVNRLSGNVVHSLSAPVHVRVPAASELVRFIDRTIDDARLGVFMGNRRNRERPAIHVFSENGDLTVIVKWSVEEKARSRQLRESDMLVALKRFAPLAGTTPTILAHLNGHLGDALVTDASAGNPAPRHLAPQLLEWRPNVILEATSWSARRPSSSISSKNSTCWSHAKRSWGPRLRERSLIFRTTESHYGRPWRLCPLERRAE